MVDVKTEIIINAPLKKVSKFTSDPDNVKKWHVNIKYVDWKTPKPMNIGTQVDFGAEFLGKRMEYTYEFVEYNPEKRLVMRTDNGAFPMETTYTWQAIDEHSTRMVLRSKGEPTGFFMKTMSRFMASSIQKTNKQDLELLKEILEK